LIEKIIGPLHDPVTWYKITHAGEQVAQWDFQKKGRSRWTGASCIVPLCNLLTSMCDFVPCDRHVQKGLHVLYQTLIAGFDHICKHLEVPEKYSSMRRIFHSLLVVWNTCFPVWYITWPTVFFFSVLNYNLSSIFFVYFLAVHRTLVDACRTIVVWAVDLFIYYVFDKVFSLKQLFGHMTKHGLLWRATVLYFMTCETWITCTVVSLK